MELPDPPPRQRRYLGGAPLESLVVQVKSTTPILGGAPVPRQVDTVDIIRAPTIRGHLRFWWRALYAHECPTATELARRECSLWGGVGRDQGTRSRAEVSVEVDRSSVREAEHPVDAKQEGDDAYYALWPARATRGGEPDAARLLPDLRFQLHLRAPAEHLREVENAVRAWVLWGGYGGRTRRGVGSLTIVGEVSKWLPRGALRDELQQAFGGLALFGSPPPEGARQVPLLQGARLFHGRPQREPGRAWFQALHWLRAFRQEQLPESSKGPANRYAREKGDRKRPGRSNWPEPDKVRRLLHSDRGRPWAHPPREEYSEDLDLDAREEPAVEAWARFLARALPEEEVLVRERFVVVDDETMDFLLETATQVDTRVRINPETGTVAEGALWKEESLPAETLLVGVLAAGPGLRQGTTLSAGEVLERALRGAAVLQLGGKATVGRGRCRLAVWPEAGKEARR